MEDGWAKNIFVKFGDLSQNFFYEISAAFTRPAGLALVNKGVQIFYSPRGAEVSGDRKSKPKFGSLTRSRPAGRVKAA